MVLVSVGGRVSQILTGPVGASFSGEGYNRPLVLLLLLAGRPVDAIGYLPTRSDASIRIS